MVVLVTATAPAAASAVPLLTAKMPVRPAASPEVTVMAPVVLTAQMPMPLPELSCARAAFTVFAPLVVRAETA